MTLEKWEWVSGDMDGPHVGGLSNEIKEMLFAKQWQITESEAMYQRANPDVEIADWRAVCRKTAPHGSEGGEGF